MSTLIPSITTCKFDSTGERRFARLLEAKLEDDYLCWYNVLIGHFGTGDLELTLKNGADLEKARPLIEKSYEAG